MYVKSHTDPALSQSIIIFLKQKLNKVDGVATHHKMMLKVYRTLFKNKMLLSQIAQVGLFAPGRKFVLGVQLTPFSH